MAEGPLRGSRSADLHKKVLAVRLSDAYGSKFGIMEMILGSNWDMVQNMSLSKSVRPAAQGNAPFVWD